MGMRVKLDERGIPTGFYDESLHKPETLEGTHPITDDQYKQLLADVGEKSRTLAYDSVSGTIINAPPPPPPTKEEQGRMDQMALASARMVLVSEVAKVIFYLVDRGVVPGEILSEPAQAAMEVLRKG